MGPLGPVLNADLREARKNQKDLRGVTSAIQGDEGDPDQGAAVEVDGSEPILDTCYIHRVLPMFREL